MKTVRGRNKKIYSGELKSTCYSHLGDCSVACPVHSVSRHLPSSLSRTYRNAQPINLSRNSREGFHVISCVRARKKVLHRREKFILEGEDAPKRTIINNLPDTRSRDSCGRRGPCPADPSHGSLGQMFRIKSISPHHQRRLPYPSHKGLS